MNPASGAIPTTGIMMKKLFAIAVLLSMSAVAQAAIVEAIVARVGDRIITRSQFANRLESGFRDIERTAPPAQVAQEKARYKDQLLNEMIAELLIKNRAERMGIVAPAAEVQRMLEQMKTQYGITSDEQLDQSLRDSGLTRADLELRLRDQIVTSEVIRRELRARADLSDPELRRRYEREKERYRRPQRARVREIVVTPENADDAASFEAARLEAEALAQRARSGGDFAAIATESSDAPTREQGGSLGTVAQGELIAILDSEVFSAQPGTVVGPIQTRAGWHLLLVEERLPSDIPGFDEVKERLRTEASEDEFERDYAAYIENLRKDAFLHVFEENLPPAAR